VHYSEHWCRLRGSPLAVTGVKCENKKREREGKGEKRGKGKEEGKGEKGSKAAHP